MNDESIYESLLKQIKCRDLPSVVGLSLNATQIAEIKAALEQRKIEIDNYFIYVISPRLIK